LKEGAMAIPPYIQFMRPMLDLLANGQSLSRKEIADRMADYFKLPAEDRLITLQSSPSMPLYRSRSGWAIPYLSKAGLLQRVEKGRYRISPEGKSVLAENPSQIDVKFLLRYPSFVAFIHPGKDAPSATDESPVALEERALEALSTPLDPVEQLQAAFEIHVNSLAQELIDRIAVMKPAAFEQLVLRLLLKMGYGGFRPDAGAAVGGPGDEGVDGLIKEDRLGLDVIYLQAKRWQNVVGRKEVQAFVGSLAGKQAQKGVFITTSSFASTALDYVRHLPNVKVILVDGEQLARFCIELGVGVQPVESYSVKRIDLDFFSSDDSA
jgi:restriction system protein